MEGKFRHGRRKNGIEDFKNGMEDNLLYFHTGPQREIFPGGTKVDTGPPNFIGPPKPYRGPMPSNLFFFAGCRSSFKSEGITIFAYS